MWETKLDDTSKVEYFLEREMRPEFWCVSSLAPNPYDTAEKAEKARDIRMNNDPRNKKWRVIKRVTVTQLFLVETDEDREG